MNKRNALCRRLLSVLTLVVAMWLPAHVWADITPVKPSAGDGSSGNPYQIGNAAELYWFAALVNGKLTDGTAQNSKACAMLTNNIIVNTGVLKADGTLADDVSGFTSWTPIGTSSTNSFSGTFDGKGHTVSGLYFNDANVALVGLFGISRGNIKNVGVVASYFKGKEDVGSVCGSSLGNTSTLCTITNCFSTSTVSGTTDVGGVCGYITYNSFTQNYHTGIVSGSNRVGGVCGEMRHSTISNCYNTGSVTCTSYSGKAGGVSGEIYGTTAKITKCFNTGAVSGSGSSVGEICGYMSSGEVTNSYYLASSSDYAGGKTAAQFASGEVTWLLNGKQPTGAWGQLLGTDNLPVLGNTNKVYYGYPSCDVSSNIGYYNNEAYDPRPAHNHVNGICSVCREWQAAEYVESSSRYEIGNAGQLAWFGALVNGTLTDVTQNNAAKGALTADIDLAPFAHWTPIGNESSKYTGQFDGQNFTVKHLNITQQGNHSGLFGYANGATIKNVRTEGEVNLNVTAYTEGYGGVVGQMDNSTVSNCHSSVNFHIESQMTGSDCCIGHIGGIVGKMHQSASSVTGCSYSGNMHFGQSYINVAGGIVGYAIYSEVPLSNCSFTGSITCNYENRTILGGIFGYTRNSGAVRVQNCLSHGNIQKTGNTEVTGVVIGQINSGYGNGHVQNNYYGATTLKAIGSTTGTPSTTPGRQCTAEQLASGEVTWLLNGKQPTGAWGQQLGTDDYPMLASPYQVVAGAHDAGTDTYWATYSNLTNDAALSVPADGLLELYNVKVSQGRMTLTQRDDNLVAQGEGVLLKTDAPYLNATPHSSTALTAAADNDLVATPSTAQTITADTGYTLYRLTYNNTNTQEGLGFYLGKVSTTTDGSKLKTTPGKAYLKVLTSEATAPASASPAMGFRFTDGQGEATSVESITITHDAHSTVADTYDISGRKVSRPARGLYITHGKKVFIK